MNSAAKLTVEMVRNAIESNMETDPMPKKILAWMLDHDNRKYTKREETKMQKEVDASIRFDDLGSMFSIVWGGYDRSGGKSGGSIFVGYDGRNVDLTKTRMENGKPVNAFAYQNRAYFDAREERNAKRREALANHEAIVAYVLNVNVLLDAQAALVQLTEYGAPLSVDTYTLEKLWKSER